MRSTSHRILMDLHQILLVALSFSCCLSVYTTATVTDEEGRAAIGRFQDYLRINTAHPNPTYAKAKDYILSRAKDLGLQTKVVEHVEEKPVIILTWKGNNPSLPSILLNSHMDSVPAEAEKWSHPPFEAHKDGSGNIYARGAQDDKCVGMQYLEAIAKLKSANKGFQPLRTIHVLYVPDEEIGGEHGFKAFASSEEFKNLNVGFMLDEGQASPDGNYRVFYADRVPWRLIIKATGAPGHGSKLYDHSAMENLMKSLNAIYGFRNAQFDLVKAGLKERGEVVSVNVAYLKAGTPTPTGFVMNLQPSEAEAGLDIRLPPTANPQILRQLISEEWVPSARNITYQLKIEGPLRDIHEEPLLTISNSSNPWWVLFEKAIMAVGGKLKKPEILMSTTDSRFVRAQGIPVLGFSPMANTPILFHDENEFLNEREYLKGIDVYASLIKSLSSSDGLGHNVDNDEL